MSIELSNTWLLETNGLVYFLLWIHLWQRLLRGALFIRVSHFRVSVCHNSWPLDKYVTLRKVFFSGSLFRRRSLFSSKEVPHFKIGSWPWLLISYIEFCKFFLIWDNGLLGWVLYSGESYSYCNNISLNSNESWQLWLGYTSPNLPWSWQSLGHLSKMDLYLRGWPGMKWADRPFMKPSHLSNSAIRKKWLQMSHNFELVQIVVFLRFIITSTLSIS